MHPCMPVICTSTANKAFYGWSIPHLSYFLWVRHMMSIMRVWIGMFTSPAALFGSSSFCRSFGPGFRLDRSFLIFHRSLSWVESDLCCTLIICPQRHKPSGSDSCWARGGQLAGIGVLAS